MKNHFLVGLFFVSAIITSTHVSARVCFEGTLAENQFTHDEVALELAAFQCRSLQVTQKGLETISIGFDIASVYAACTGYGLPVTVGLQSASIGLRGIKLIVDSLPCDKSQEEKQIVKQVKSAVCDDLRSQGIKCQP